MLAALLLALLSFALTAFISRAVFDRLPHLEDEVAYLFQAEVFAQGDLVIQAPVPALPFWKPFVVDHSSGTRFSKYTPGWSGWLSVGVRLGEPWIINAFFGMLTVALIYRVGREVFNRDVGLVAALLLTFAPIALLLNATLMSHTSALFFATLFIYSYWRLTRSTRRWLLWGGLAGAALGMLVINRPLSAVGIVVPYVVFSLLRLGRTLVQDRAAFLPTLRPLILLGVLALTISLAIPIYNYAATGDPTTNLYTLVWAYDKVGFGEGFGKTGHTLEKGIQFARYDLSLLAADLFGWQAGSVTTEIQQGLLSSDGYYPLTGLSWILLLPGLIIGFGHRKAWVWLWAINVGIWFWWMPSGVENNLTVWLLVGAILLFAPLIFVFDRRETSDHQPLWTWLLLATVISLIMVHLAYWIGSQRYSTRYYFEMITAAVLLSALPVAFFIQRLKRPGWRLAVYGVLVLLCLWSFVTYSTPRIDALRDFNRITPEFLQAVNARRTTDKPLLVLITGVNGVGPSWRSFGPLMIVTGPYLDTDIVAASDHGRPGRLDEVRQMFPDREIIELYATNISGGDHAWFKADCLPNGECPIIANPPREW